MLFGFREGRLPTLARASARHRVIGGLSEGLFSALPGGHVPTRRWQQPILRPADTIAGAAWIPKMRNVAFSWVRVVALTARSGSGRPQPTLEAASRRRR
jgi:hypothetical protein